MMMIIISMHVFLSNFVVIIIIIFNFSTELKLSLIKFILIYYINNVRDIEYYKEIIKKNNFRIYIIIINYYDYYDEYYEYY